VDLKDNFSNKKLPLADVEIDNDNWYYCTIRNNKFEGDGGLYNLIDVLSIFTDFVNAKNTDYWIDSKRTINAHLLWLLQWYANQCDGDWEHMFGVKIKTLDNPSWSIQIDIQETALQDKVFQEVDIKYTDDDWVFCSPHSAPSPQRKGVRLDFFR
jgi:hypothetical protein